MAYRICLDLRALHFPPPRGIMAYSIFLDLRALPFFPPHRGDSWRTELAWIYALNLCEPTSKPENF